MSTSKTDPARPVSTLLFVAWGGFMAVLCYWLFRDLPWPPVLTDLLPALLLLPPAAVITAVARGSRYAAAVGVLVLIPYVGWGITDVLADPKARLPATLVVFTASACFVLLAAWLRVTRGR